MFRRFRRFRRPSPAEKLAAFMEGYEAARAEFRAELAAYSNSSRAPDFPTEGAAGPPDAAASVEAPVPPLVTASPPTAEELNAEAPPPKISQSLVSPFDTPLTPRQKQIVDIGWEVMKHVDSPHVFLWLEEDGWEGGHELNAWQHSPGVAAIKIKPWPTLVLLHSFSPN